MVINHLLTGMTLHPSYLLFFGDYFISKHHMSAHITPLAFEGFFCKLFSQESFNGTHFGGMKLDAKLEPETANHL